MAVGVQKCSDSVKGEMGVLVGQIRRLVSEAAVTANNRTYCDEIIDSLQWWTRCVINGGR